MLVNLGIGPPSLVSRLLLPQNGRRRRSVRRRLRVPEVAVGGACFAGEITV